MGTLSSESVQQDEATWQDLDGFQEYLHPYALDKISLSIGRIKSTTVPPII